MLDTGRKGHDKMADTTSTLIPGWISSWVAFVKGHEKLLLIFASALVLWHYANTIQKYFDDKRIAQQSQTNQQITQVETQNQALLQQLAVMQQNFNTTVQTLNAKIDAQKQTVIIQQKKDDAMPPVELSARWSELIKAPAGNIEPESNGNIGVSVDAAHTTVNQLEQIPQLEEQVLDQNTELTACTELSAKKDDTINGLKNDVALEKKGRIEDAKVAKINQRKSWRKGFKWGFFTGFFGGFFVRGKV